MCSLTKIGKQCLSTDGTSHHATLAMCSYHTVDYYGNNLVLLHQCRDFVEVLELMSLSSALKVSDVKRYNM